jgi:hypothetical protein
MTHAIMVVSTTRRQHDNEDYNTMYITWRPTTTTHYYFERLETHPEIDRPNISGGTFGGLSRIIIIVRSKEH